MIKNIKNTFLLLLVSFSLSACISSKNEVNNTSLPSWFVNINNQDNESFYGTSSAYSLEEAKKQALKNISSYLSIEISSKTNISKKSSNNTFEKNISQNIQTSTKKLQFTNAEIIKNQVLDSKYYVLVKVNKEKLFQENKNILFLADKNIDTKINENKNLSLLEQIKTLSNLEKTLKDSKDRAYILYAIKNSFDYKTYVNKYQTLLNKKDSLISKIIINAKNSSFSKDSSYFNEELINFFNDNSYKVSKKAFNVKSIIITKLNFSKYKDWFITKSTTSVKIYSSSKIISTHIIKAVGRSSSSQANANVSASNNFKKELKKLGINKILFSK